jgi:hypothetical protein
LESVEDSIRIRLTRATKSQVEAFVSGQPRIDQPANLMHGIRTTMNHEFKRRDARENSVSIRQLDPFLE